MIRSVMGFQWEDCLMVKNDEGEETYPATAIKRRWSEGVLLHDISSFHQEPEPEREGVGLLTCDNPV